MFKSNVVLLLMLFVSFQRADATYSGEGTYYLSSNYTDLTQSTSSSFSFELKQGNEYVFSLVFPANLFGYKVTSIGIVHQAGEGAYPVGIKNIVDLRFNGDSLWHGLFGNPVSMTFQESPLNISIPPTQEDDVLSLHFIHPSAGFDGTTRVFSQGFGATRLFLSTDDWHPTAAIRTILMPEEAVAAGAKWRINDGDWNETNQVIECSPRGAHTVEFLSVPRWRTPQSQEVVVNSFEVNECFGTYYRDVGSVKIEVTPDYGQWELTDNLGNIIDGVGNTTLHNIPSGLTTLTWKEIDGYFLPVPNPHSFTVKYNITATITGYYFPPGMGSLRVIIEPSEVRSKGAKWRVDDGEWRSSGNTIYGLDVGLHTVSFKDVPGWLLPTNEVVLVKEGERTVFTGVYEIAPTYLRVILGSGEEIAEQTGWRLVDGQWMPSDTVLTVLPGKHTLEFREVEGWNHPVAFDVECKEGFLTKVVETYTPGGLLHESQANPNGSSRVSHENAGYVVFNRFENINAPIEMVKCWGKTLSYNDGWEVCDNFLNEFSLRFYKNNGGVPGTLVSEQQIEAYKISAPEQGDNVYSFSLYLDQPVPLSSGWVSIVGLGDEACRFLWRESLTSDDCSLFKYVDYPGYVVLEEEYSLSLWGRDGTVLSGEEGCNLCPGMIVHEDYFDSIDLSGWSASNSANVQVEDGFARLSSDVLESWPSITYGDSVAQHLQISTQVIFNEDAITTWVREVGVVNSAGAQYFVDMVKSNYNVGCVNESGAYSMLVPWRNYPEGTTFPSFNVELLYANGHLRIKFDDKEACRVYDQRNEGPFSGYLGAYNGEEEDYTLFDNVIITSLDACFEGEVAISHAADTNADWRIALSEAIAYLTGWQQGSNPLAYAIRAAYIWQNGEQYIYDAEQAPPLCWVLAP